MKNMDNETGGGGWGISLQCRANHLPPLGLSETNERNEGSVQKNNKATLTPKK